MNPTTLQTKMHGIFTTLLTPFRADGAIDEPALRRLIDACVRQGVHGIVPCGSLGEFPALSFEERSRVVQIAVEQVSGRVPVIAGTAHSGTIETIRISQDAQRLGADGIMVTAPYFSTVTEEGVYRHYIEVAKSVSLGVIVYNTPRRAGFELSPKLLARLAKIDNVVAIKQGSRNIEEIIDTVALAGDQVSVMSGAEPMMLACYMTGMVGTTGVSSHFLGRIFVQIYELARLGRLEEARKVFDPLYPYFAFTRRTGHPQAAKAALSILGLCEPHVRMPLLPLPEAQTRELEELLKSLGIDRKDFAA